MATQWLRFLALLAFFGFTLVMAAPSAEPATYLRHQRRALEKQHERLHRRSNVTVSGNGTSALADAQKLIDDMVAQQGAYNAYRVKNPRRNNYYADDLPKPDSVQKKVRRRDDEPAPPTLNSTISTAAALLAEHHANQQASNGTLHKIYKQPTTLKRVDDTAEKRKRATGDYWLGAIEHTGKAPMGQDDSWQVYRDVTDFGAVGDGVTDDTEAINNAISQGGNCGDGCLSSSIKPTLIYFPPGTYLVSTPIQAMYYSQLVGDANDLPVIKTSPKFIGLGAIETDVYEPNANGDEWYINQSNFYRQVRNFIIDVQDTTTDSVAGLHWQVAQATSLTNVYVYASTDDDTTSMGMFTENGSSGFMGECFFYGGQYGIYGGNQQYTVRSFEFEQQTTASICLIWDWGWTWSQLYVASSPIAIMLINPDDPTGQQAGSIYVMDSGFYNVGAVIFANSEPADILGSSIITLDNLGIEEVTSVVTFADGSTLAIPAENLNFIIIGNVEADGSAYGMYEVAVNAPSDLLTTSKVSYYRDSYFFKARPQYEDLSVSDIINVKDYGATGDGVTDDTAAVKSALADATTSNLVYFPAGSYIITNGITIQPGTRMTGEVWSQLVASGDGGNFMDTAYPQPLIRIGEDGAGDTGVVEISDMMFTSKGALPGLILMEWNIAADDQGSAGLWDAHFRLGGAAGTEMQVAQCPKGATLQEGCIAASMMLHVTSGANGYFENMWAWVADHDLDDSANTMITVACARGILVESAGPTWMLGTASEHSILYQYNFYGATNVWAGMIQTESPYFQFTESTESPGVFSDSVGQFDNDPIFPDDTCAADDLMCNFSWAVQIYSTTNLTISGAGLYSWFDNYDQSVCVDAQNCQQRLVNNQGANNQLYMFNMITIGAVEMLSDTDDGTIIYAANNTQANAHPFWSVLGAYLDEYSTEPHFCADDDTTPACFVAPKCDYSLSYATLEDLDGASGSWPAECLSYYMLGTLNNLLSEALDNYTSVNDGYDSVYNYYVKAVKNEIPSALSTFMDPGSSDNPDGGAGNQYFKCDFVETTGGGNDKITYNPCPVPYKQIDYVYAYTMTYTLEDSDGFYNALQSTYGIEKDWVTLGTWSNPNNGPCSGGVGGGGSGKNLDKRCDEINIYYYNYPQVSGDVTVSNPKDVVTAALPSIGNLQTTILARQMDLMMGQWTGPTDDLLQVISMPVFLMVQAVQSMQSAKQQAEEEEEEEDTALILEILGIVFAFIPFLDDITPAIEGLDVAIEILNVAGNSALAIQGIIADPESAPMEILGALGGGVEKNEDDIATLAAARRSQVSADDIKKIGAKFEDLDTKMQSMIKGKACSI
ncbi:hypothetical protein LQW54_000509 [Pestalotiopsis sp. IQ-011]